MSFHIVQINCAPHGNEYFPIPKTFSIIRSFASESEAKHFWPNDLVHNPPPEYDGQYVYQVLWDASKSLNLDRYNSNSQQISNCGMWLPEEVYTAPATQPLEHPHIPLLTKTPTSKSFTVKGAIRPATKGSSAVKRPPGKYLPSNPHRTQ